MANPLKSPRYIKIDSNLKTLQGTIWSYNFLLGGPRSCFDIPRATPWQIGLKRISLVINSSLKGCKILWQSLVGVIVIHIKMGVLI